MGFKDLVSNTILRMDLLSTSVSFRTRKQPYYQTIAGGLLSFIIMGFFGYFLYIQMADMFQKLDISYTSSVDDDVTKSSAITSFPFAVSINGIDLSSPTKKFTIKLNQFKITKNDSGTPVTTSTQLTLEPCQSSNWINYGSTFAEQFSAFGFSEMLCVASGQNISLSGYGGSTVYQYLSLTISQCNHTLYSDCDTPSNINTFMSNYLNVNDYFKVKFYVVDTIVTPTNEDAISYVLEKNIFLSFSDTIGTVGYINMAEFQLLTDNNPLPVQEYESQSGSYIQKFVSNSVSLSTTKYVTFSIYRSTVYLSISRTIGKIDSVLSYVGGLFSLLFTGIAFFLGSYSQYKYQIYVAESMLTDDNGTRVKEDDFNFLTYFFYCLYDWMDTFGIAPTCFTKLKRIHEIRQESCQQLDPVIVLNRIKYLENVSKVLISEHKQMCLYLSEPWTLQQSKRMRKTLLFYNELMDEMHQNKEVSVQNSNDQKLFSFGKSNAVRNQSELIAIKPLEREEEKYIGDEQEKKMLQNLIFEAVQRLQEDNSQSGMKIKTRVSERTRQWIKETKKYNKTSEMTESGNQFEAIVPADKMKDQLTSPKAMLFASGKKGARISFKKARR